MDFMDCHVRSSAPEAPLRYPTLLYSLSAHFVPTSSVHVLAYFYYADAFRILKGLGLLVSCDPTRHGNLIPAQTYTTIDGFLAIDT